MTQLRRTHARAVGEALIQFSQGNLVLRERKNEPVRALILASKKVRCKKMIQRPGLWPDYVEELSPCKHRATHRVNGQPLCKRHAGEELLAMLEEREETND